MSKVYAPFTPARVASLNAFQASGAFHEFTCGSDATVLMAREDGWHCPACTYTQDWAYEPMADESWRTRPDSNRRFASFKELPLPLGYGGLQP